ncbi:MAG: DNA alkylation repair protein [Thermoplasmata archaeon]
MERKEVLQRLNDLADPEGRAGMARFGIATDRALGIRIPKLRRLAKEVGRDHDLALELWETRIHEARILASMVDDPAHVTEGQMEAWVGDFDSWDVCDQVCGNLFDKTPYAYRKAVSWSGRNKEFVKRAGFALMAWIAAHDKKAEDAAFLPFLPLIVRASVDDRNFVKKAVNWALRQIGKRNRNLNRRAIVAAERVRGLDARAARWIAGDALRELRSAAVQARLARR